MNYSNLLSKKLIRHLYHLDIDNEFDEIDSLLRDVESLKIDNDPSHNEHKEEYNIEILFI